MNYAELLAERAEQYGDKPFLMGEKTVSYRQMLQNVRRMECSLEARAKGKTTAIRSERPEFQLTAFFAVSAVGGIPVLIPAGQPERSLISLLETPEISGLLEDDAEGRSPGCDTIGSFLFRDTGFSSPSHEDVCMGVLTSGSTGMPKLYFRSYDSWAGFFPVQNGIFQVDSGTVLFLNGSMSFTGNLNTALSVLWAGGTLVESAALSPGKWADLLESRPVTHIYLVPAKLHLLERALKAPHGKVKVIFTGSQQLTKENLSRLRQKFPSARILLYYGASELSYVTWLTDAELEKRPDSVGRPFPGVKVTVRDGLVYADSPWHVAGVTPPLTVSDRGVLDGDGYLFLEGRSDGIVNVGGVKVSLGKVESALRKIDGVSACAAVAYPEKKRGSRIAVFLVSQGLMTGNDVRNRLKTELLPRELPAKIHFLSELPLNGSGKPDTAALEKMAAGFDSKTEKD